MKINYVWTLDRNPNIIEIKLWAKNKGLTSMPKDVEIQTTRINPETVREIMVQGFKSLAEDLAKERIPQEGFETQDAYEVPVEEIQVDESTEVS